ncbi:hypothetical protein ACS0TY_023839 [Phlomoides rotata]
MKEIIEKVWKVENGFRTEYQKVALKALKEKTSMTDLSADHIKNKIHVWKKFHTSLQGMFDTSGFEWDEARKVMTFRDDDIWDEYKRQILVLTNYTKAEGDPLDEGHETNEKAETEVDTDENDYYVSINVGKATSGKKK